MEMKTSHRRKVLHFYYYRIHFGYFTCKILMRSVKKMKVVSVAYFHEMAQPKAKAFPIVHFSKPHFLFHHFLFMWRKLSSGPDCFSLSMLNTIASKPILNHSPTRTGSGKMSLVSNSSKGIFFK